jgi:hypothetical protein
VSAAISLLCFETKCGPDSLVGMGEPSRRAFYTRQFLVLTMLTAIRMAQDMGLFRDVDRWYMPAAAQLSYEEKQTRKRVWWGCVILDRCVLRFAPLRHH